MWESTINFFQKWYHSSVRWADICVKNVTAWLNKAKELPREAAIAYGAFSVCVVVFLVVLITGGPRANRVDTNADIIEVSNCLNKLHEDKEAVMALRDRIEACVTATEKRLARLEKSRGATLATQDSVDSVIKEEVSMQLGSLRDEVKRQKKKQKHKKRVKRLLNELVNDDDDS